MRLRRLAGIGLAAALGLGAVPAPAAQLQVGAGSALFLGSGRLDLGCADLVVGGTLTGGTGTLDRARHVTINGALYANSATLNVAGDWSNAGLFQAGTSTVNFVDGCLRAGTTISGSSSFFVLDVTTSNKTKGLTFAAGSTTTVTGHLTLAGTPGQLLHIRSTVDGSEAYLDVQGGQAVSYVDVKDNHAIGDPIYYGSDSASLGNTDGWVLVAAAAVPALAPWTLVPLAALLLAVAAVARRRPNAPGGGQRLLG